MRQVIAILLLATVPGLPAGRIRSVMRTEPANVQSGQPAELTFAIRDAKGASIRFLQNVHERPMHLLVVSTDLAEFAHIHPELDTADNYSVSHTFPYGGDYHLYADYTPPGSGSLVDNFSVNVAGARRLRVPLVADKDWTKTQAGLRVSLSATEKLRAGQDLLLKFAVASESDGSPVTDLQPYLGAFAHVVVISQDLREFIHAHPIETAAVEHIHTAARQIAGPSPAEVRAYINFPGGGLYKLWAQFQRADRVITVPFALQIAEPDEIRPREPIPEDAIRVNVSSSGYSPARVEVRKGQKIKLAFFRSDGRNCGSEVLIPSLKIRRKLPVAEPVVIEMAPREPGEITFSCGMGMLRGLVVVQ